MAATITAIIVFIFSLLSTSLVSFFAVMIISDQRTRLSFKDNLIGGLAMHLVGPLPLRLAFHAFVVVVGIMILSGAINTALVGSNGVLNRLSEDGVLSNWFRHPHPRFGTSHRIINLVVALQLLTILLSRGDVILLGEAYAFGVIWSFAMKGLGVLVLRFVQPGPRDYRVPLNLRIGRYEFPVGLGLITLTLFAIAVVNLLTKQIATVAGVAFTLVFYVIFTVSERISRKRACEDAGLDQFHLQPRDDLSPETLDVRPGNLLVLVRDYNTLYNLEQVLKIANPKRQDVVVLHLRLLKRGSSGEHGLVPEQLFTFKEQELFTRALNIAEKSGKTIHLAVAAATDKWDGILRAAQSLQSSLIVLGRSPSRSVNEEARIAGLAWEGLPDPKPQLTLEIHSPTGREHVFYLGPHAPSLTPKEVELLHRIWLKFSDKLAPEDVHHHDIVHFALNELENEFQNGRQQDLLDRLKQHLQEIRQGRNPDE